MQLLTEAVRVLERSGRSTAAAGVGAKMRQLDRSFTFRYGGWSSFRQLLDTAVERGLIELDRGPNDFILRLAAQVTPDRPVSRPRSLRRDLWSAILDWAPDARYAFNRRSRTTERVHREITTDEVIVPTLSKDHHVQWMREFAEAEIARDADSPLAAALTADDAAAEFAAALGKDDAASRRWKRQLRHRVIDRVLAWSAENHIPVSDLSAPSPTAEHETPPLPQTDSIEGVDDEELREWILATLRTLPLHELLRLRIPVGYTLRR